MPAAVSVDSTCAGLGLAESVTSFFASEPPAFVREAPDVLPIANCASLLVEEADVVVLDGRTVAEATGRVLSAGADCVVLRELASDGVPAPTFEAASELSFPVEIELELGPECGSEEVALPELRAEPMSPSWSRLASRRRSAWQVESRHSQPRMKPKIIATKMP